MSAISRYVGGVIFFFGWFFLIFKLPVYWVYTLTIPPIVVVNLARNRAVRDRFITLFVLIWLIVYFYNNTRLMLLRPFIQRHFPRAAAHLPVNQFLFPPAGPIMFLHLDDTFAHFVVYGVKDLKLYELNPHKIIQNRTLFYDNTHRGVLSAIADRETAPSFCRMMDRRFPEFDDFVVALRRYRSLSRQPHIYEEAGIFRCRQIFPKESLTP